MSKKSIACIIYDKNKQKIFIAKRVPVGDMGGKWEFPGGKIENNEETKCAIVREMQEEFNTTVTVGAKIAETTFTHHNENVLLSAYAVSFEHDGMDKKFDLTEHTEYKWVNVETIPTLDFVDSDLKIYPQVLDYINKNK